MGVRKGETSIDTQFSSHFITITAYPFSINDDVKCYKFCVNYLQHIILINDDTYQNRSNIFRAYYYMP